MRFDISPAAREAQLLGFLSFLSAGAGYPAIELHSAPVVAAGAVAGSALVTVLLQKPAALLQGGVLVLQPLTAEGELALSTGAAAWARFLNGSGVWVADADVTVDDGDGVVRLPSLSILAGGRVPLRPSAIG